MYADKMTDSMTKAIEETSRRRSIQEAYNEEHGIVPKTIIKEIRDLISISKHSDEEESGGLLEQYESLNREEKKELLLELEAQMKDAAKDLDFEKAATLRDTILELKSGK